MANRAFMRRYKCKLILSKAVKATLMFLNFVASLEQPFDRMIYFFFVWNLHCSIVISRSLFVRGWNNLLNLFFSLRWFCLGSQVNLIIISGKKVVHKNILELRGEFATWKRCSLHFTFWSYTNLHNRVSQKIMDLPTLAILIELRVLNFNFEKSPFVVFYRI